MSTILQRINQISENEGIKIGTLEHKIGASKGVLSRAINNNTDIQAKWLTKIVDNYPKYEAYWLLTGKEPMLRKENESKNGILVAAKEMSGEKAIPLVSEHAIAGFGNAEFSIKEQDVKDYYVIPKFKYCNIDFMIEIHGSSMYPKYNSGDVVACTIIRESKFIQWNKCHVIATREQGLLVKRLKKGNAPDSLLAISDNKDYDPFQIPVNEITGIALVVGVIRLE